MCKLITVSFMIAALTGDDLAIDNSVAPLPLALLQLAVMATGIPG